MSIIFEGEYNPHKKRGEFTLKDTYDDTKKWHVEIQDMAIKDFADLSSLIKAYGTAREKMLNDFVIRKLRDLLYCLDHTYE